MGPLVSAAQLDRVLHSVARGVDEGATLEYGGHRLDRPGYYMQPTLFSNVRPGMSLAEEEIFGPVISLMTYRSIDEALCIANDSAFGLSAELITHNLDWAARAAAALDVGHVSINGGGGFGIDTPFGGVRHSGWGREGGLEALRQYSRTKSIVTRIQLADQRGQDSEPR
jgi:acyl-CoA reductase-like NAD-dependent aldehyde dehydrogenase